MRKKHTVFLLSFMVMAAALFASCGSRDTGEEKKFEMVDETVLSESVLTKPATEDELRQALDQAGDGEDSAAKKREYYETLLAMDVFTESDYAALAEVYEAQGERQLQRRMLWKALRLYPSEERVQQIGRIAVPKEDQDTLSFAGEIVQALQQDVETLKNLTHSQEWQRIFRENMTGVEVRTKCLLEDGLLQVAAGEERTEVTYRQSTGAFYSFQLDESGCIWAFAEEENGSYNGIVTVVCQDAEGNVIREYNGTLKEGVCVDQLTVVYQGMEYTGMFNSDGTTAQKQPSEMAEQGAVAYACGSDGRSYLIWKNVTAENFKADFAFLGLPEYAVWE